MAVKLKFNLLVIDTFSRLQGVKAFLETVGKGVPVLEDQERLYLQQRASDGRWEFEDYNAKRAVLDQNFETWIPVFVAYSVILLLYSVIEAQLFALADHLGGKRNSAITVNDIAGRGLERSAKFLQLVLLVDVKADPAWERLQDLRKLRDFVAHNNGRDSGAPKSDIIDLVKRHGNYLEFKPTDGFTHRTQLWVSLDFCRELANCGEQFFERTFALAGLARHSLVRADT